MPDLELKAIPDTRQLLPPDGAISAGATAESTQHSNEFVARN